MGGDAGVWGVGGDEAWCSSLLRADGGAVGGEAGTVVDRDGRDGPLVDSQATADERETRAPSLAVARWPGDPQPGADARRPRRKGAPEFFTPILDRVIYS